VASRFPHPASAALGCCVLSSSTSVLARTAMLRHGSLFEGVLKDGYGPLVYLQVWCPMYQRRLTGTGLVAAPHTLSCRAHHRHARWRDRRCAPPLHTTWRFGGFTARRRVYSMYSTQFLLVATATSYKQAHFMGLYPPSLRLQSDARYRPLYHIDPHLRARRTNTGLLRRATYTGLTSTAPPPTHTIPPRTTTPPPTPTRATCAPPHTHHHTPPTSFSTAPVPILVTFLAVRQTWRLFTSLART